MIFCENCLVASHITFLRLPLFFRVLRDFLQTHLIYNMRHRRLEIIPMDNRDFRNKHGVANVVNIGIKCFTAPK